MRGIQKRIDIPPNAFCRLFPMLKISDPVAGPESLELELLPLDPSPALAPIAGAVSETPPSTPSPAGC